MFAIWLLSSAIANFFAGITGSYIDPVVQDYGMAAFFLIFTIIPTIVGMLMIFFKTKKLLE